MDLSPCCVLGISPVCTLNVNTSFSFNARGWGIRALNAIPKGSFICTYAGAIYDDNKAIEVGLVKHHLDYLIVCVSHLGRGGRRGTLLRICSILIRFQEGYDYGDEYQAELDYIETVEKHKDGYEPYAILPDYGSDGDSDRISCPLAPPPPTTTTTITASTFTANATAPSRTARKRNNRTGGRVRRNSSSSCVSTQSASSSVISRPTLFESLTRTLAAIKVPPPDQKDFKPSSPTAEDASNLDTAKLDETKSSLEFVGVDKCEFDEESSRAVKFETDSIVDSQPSASGNNADDQSEFSDITGRGNLGRSDAESICSSDVPASTSTLPMDACPAASAVQEGIKPPEFSVSMAPGLTSPPEGISNLSEILSVASFTRKPVVQLTRLTDIPKRKSNLCFSKVISFFKIDIPERRD